jgi:uncharacterized membrane protein YqhA
VLSKLEGVASQRLWLHIVLQGKWQVIVDVIFYVHLHATSVWNTVQTLDHDSVARLVVKVVHTEDFDLIGNTFFQVLYSMSGSSMRVAHTCS